MKTELTTLFFYNRNKVIASLLQSNYLATLVAFSHSTKVSKKFELFMLNRTIFYNHLITNDF